MEGAIVALEVMFVAIGVKKDQFGWQELSC